MYDRQHRSSKNASQSAHTQAKNPFAPSKFVVQTKQEERQPVSAEEYERIKASEGNYHDSSIVTNRPTPKPPTIQRQQIINLSSETSATPNQEEREEKKPVTLEGEEPKKEEEEEEKKRKPRGGLPFRVPNIEPSGNREGGVR